MRILIIHSQYLSGWASGENSVVRDEAKLLLDAGHDVVTWTPHPRPGLSKARLGLMALWSSSAVEHMERLLLDHRPDIVHCHNLFPMLSPTILRRANGAGLVVTLHNYRYFCLPATAVRDGEICELCLGRLPWNGIRYRCYRNSLPGSAALAASLALHRAMDSFGHVSLFLPVSRFVRDKHVQAGLDPNKMIVKHNFCWPSRRRQGLGEYFLYAGRLAPEKDVETLLKAWKSIDAPLVIAGDGPDRAALEATAHANVEFLGIVSPETVSDLLRGARALLLPTRCNEGGPRSVLEAYAVGVPVIATALGALPELVEDGVSGRLVPADRKEAWIDAIAQLADRGTAEQLGNGAFRLWEERYSPQVGLDGIEAAYRVAART